VSPSADTERHLLQILSKLSEEHEKARVRLDAAQDTVNRLSERMRSIEEALEIVREEQSEDSQVDAAMQQRLRNKTVREMLTELALESTPPTFHVAEMSRRLVRGGMFEDLLSARNAVYSCVGRNERYFAKLGPGHYLATPQRASQGLPKPTSNKRRSRKDSTGLRDRVSLLRQEHPDWTERQVTAELKRQGWDFGASLPHRAVRGVYMWLKQHQPNQSPLRSVS